MFLTSPDALFQSTFSQQIASLRTRLDRAASEMVTGRKSDTLAATRGDSQTLLRAQAQIDTADGEKARLTVIEGRYRVAAQTLRTVNELAADAAKAAQAAGDITAGINADRFAATEARGALATIFSSLEARFGGRALFGGTLGSGTVLADVSVLFSEVDTAIGGLTSLADIEAAVAGVFTPGGAFETAVYQGGAALPDPQLADGQTVNAVPTAASDGLRQLFTGLSLAGFAERAGESERPALLRRSAEIIQSATEALVAEEASLGLAEKAIGRELQRQDDLLFTAQATLDRLIGRDSFEAASETQSLEARLQAAYTVTSRLSALRLTNFLR